MPTTSLAAWPASGSQALGHEMHFARSVSQREVADKLAYVNQLSLQL
jgi:hypothetical protein